jgi:hypothetical protein
MRRVRTVGLLAAVLGIVTALILVMVWVRTAPAGTAGTSAPLPTPTARHSKVQDLVDGIKEVNYYPAANGWAYMWSNFDAAVIDRDFGRIQGMGANTVRIFIQPSVFGFPAVSPVMAGRLAEVIALAARHSLRVQLTLFDWWSQYTDISGSKEWVASLLSPYRDDPRIAVIELKNEVKPQDSAAVAWVVAMLPYLSTVMPGTLRTVSVANISPQLFALFTRELKNSPPDFWDYHYYGPAWDAYSWLSQIEALAAPRPLFVGETGYSTVGTNGDEAALEQAQAAYYRIVFTAALALGLPDPAPWILNDFAPDAIPPSKTADDPSTYGYGLYSVGGTPKPAVAVITAAFAGKLGDFIDGSFEDESLPGGMSVAGAWEVADPSQAMFAISHSVAYQASASAEISDSATGSPGQFAYLYTVPVQPVQAGAVWTASAWARGTGTSGTARIALRWINGSGAYVGSSVSAPLPPGDSAWTRLTAEGKVPSGAVAVLVLLETKDDPGTAWFDGVSAGPAAAGSIPAALRM